MATVALSDTDESIARIVCKIYLPKRTTESALLVFLADHEQEERLRAVPLVWVHVELRQLNEDANNISSRPALITKYNTNV